MRLGEIIGLFKDLVFVFYLVFFIVLSDGIGNFIYLSREVWWRFRYE